jgi:hypothetical protein
MPQYFFGLHDQPPPEHQIGEELSDDDAARRFAEAVAEELGRNNGSPPTVRVYDVEGKRIT